MNCIRSLKHKLYEGLLCSFKESEPNFFTFGIAVLIGVLGFYFLNKKVIAEDAYENFTLRLLSGICVIPLIFYKYWPTKLKFLQFWYWYFVLIYTLPFFFSFMILMNSSSNIWQINGIICFVVLALFVDWLSFLLLLMLGVVSGLIFYAYEKVGSGPFIPIELQPVLYSYLGPIIYIILFSRKKENIHHQKIQTMKMLAGSIAHELRTPLSALMMNARTLRRILPSYQEGYAKAKAARLLQNTLEPDQEAYIEELPENMQTLSNNAHTMITMLLANLNEGTAGRKVENCSMKLCVEEALKTYPFSTSERELVHWEGESMTEDFTFLGHKELTKHVLFNLIKNALYAIASAGKGGIFITLEADATKKSKCLLIFKDTGIGITPDNLLHIFDRFYTKTLHGTGIGLAFCKETIEGFGGKITCTSREGEHTTFTISLPSARECQLAA